MHRRGLKLIRPGVKCCDIASELNEIYADRGLLEHRSFGYGHSFGTLCHYYGREDGEYEYRDPGYRDPGIQGSRGTTVGVTGLRGTETQRSRV